MAIQIPGPSVDLQRGGNGAPQIANPDSGSLLGIARGLKQAAGAAETITQNSAKLSDMQKAANEKVLAAQQKAQEELQHKDNLATALQAETLTQEIIRDHRLKIQTERQGLNAKGVVEDSTTFLDDNIQQIGDSIENPDARAMYTQRAMELRNSTLDSIASFQAAQMNNALIDANAASVKGNVAYAASNAGNPNAIAVSRDNITKAIDNLTLAQGWAPEKRQFELDNALLTMHTQVFDNLSAVSPDAAAAYYKDNKKEMASNSDYFEKVLKVHDDLVPAQKLVDKLMTEHTTFDEKEQAVRNQLDGQQRENAMRLLREQKVEFKAEEDATQAAYASAAYKQFGPTQTISAIEPTIWARLTGEQQQALRDKERIAASDKPEVTDKGDYLKLTQLAGLQPDQFMKEDLMLYKLSTADFKHFADQRQQIAAGAGRPIETFVQAINAASETLNPDQKANFIMATTDKVNAHRDALKRELTPQELKADIAEMRSTLAWNAGNIFHFIFGDKKATVPELLADPVLFKSWIDSVPAEEKKQIQKNFPNADQETILRVYMKAHPTQ